MILRICRPREEERRLEGGIEALLARAQETDAAQGTDAAEEARFGDAFQGDDLLAELQHREQRPAGAAASGLATPAGRRASCAPHVARPCAW